jgi:hypothetical protein
MGWVLELVIKRQNLGFYSTHISLPGYVLWMFNYFGSFYDAVGMIQA